jgi:hypothetical protein
MYLFLMVQALVVVFEDGLAFCFAAVVFGVCVGDVAGEDFLPEGEAAGGACEVWGQLMGVECECWVCGSCGGADPLDGEGEVWFFGGSSGSLEDWCRLWGSSMCLCRDTGFVNCGISGLVPLESVPSGQDLRVYCRRLRPRLLHVQSFDIRRNRTRGVASVEDRAMVVLLSASTAPKPW